MSRNSVGIVGAGAVGTALAELLSRAGHNVSGIATRRSKSLDNRLDLLDLNEHRGHLSPGSWCAQADVLLITVPDDVIREVVDDIARQGVLSDDTLIVHCSGAHTAEQLLSPLHDPSSGRRIGSFHPLQTVPDPESGIRDIPDAWIAVEGAPDVRTELEDLARQIGARPFHIPPERKDLYHAAAVFASNHLIGVLSVASQLMRDAAEDLDQPLEPLTPLIESSLSNALEESPDSVLTGPAVRGDADTMDAHVSAIERVDDDYRDLYAELTQICLDIAQKRGELSEKVVASLRSRFT